VDAVDGNPPVFQIRVLGPVEVQTNPGSSFHAAPYELAPKLRLLISVLASRSGQWVTNEALVNELWPETPIASTSKTLQGNILRLRRVLGSETLLSRRGSYSLSKDASLDATEFKRRVEAIERSTNRDHSDHAISEVLRAEVLWRGEPFENVDDTPAIVQSRKPLSTMRHRLRELRIDLLIKRGDVRSSVVELERCVEVDPYREDYWALLIRSLYITGRQSDALNAFGRARRVLAADLGLEPGSTLRALEAAILRSDDAMIRSGEIVGASRVVPLSAAVAPALDVLDERRKSRSIDLANDPFVGRTRELVTARELVKSVRGGRRRTLVIQGAAGIGKSRLLAEIVAEAEAFGCTTVVSRNDSLFRRSYGVVIDLLDQLELVRSRHSHSTDELLDPEFTQPIERLRKLRMLGTAGHVFDAPSSNPALDRQIIAEVANKQLTTAARRFGPLIVVIEDIQWADSGTLDVIRELTLSPTSAPILVGLTYRNETRRPEIAEILHELDRSGQATRMQLAELSEDEIRDLMTRAGGGKPPTMDDLRVMLARTDGNTLLVRELAATTQPSRRTLIDRPATLPESIRDLVDSYLSHCSEHATAIAEAGGLCGRSFDPELAAVVTARTSTAEHPDSATLSELTDELERSGLIIATPSRALMFRHDLFRDATIARLEKPDVRELHQAFLNELELRSSDDLDALVLHSVGAEQASKSAHRLTQRARRSLAAGLINDAINDCNHAIEWHRSDPAGSLSAKLATTLILADAQSVNANRPAAKLLLHEVLESSVGLSLNEQTLIAAGAHRRLASAHMNDRNVEAANQELEAAAKWIGTTEPKPNEPVEEWIDVWLEATVLDYFLRGSIAWAAAALELVTPVVNRRGNLRQSAKLISTTAMNQLRMARFSPDLSVLTLKRNYRELALKLGDLGLIAESTFSIGFTHLCRLEGNDAYPYFDQAIELHQRSGDRFWESLSRAYAAATRRLAGDVDGTETHCRSALAFGSEIMSPSYVAVVESSLAWVALRRASNASGEERVAYRTVADAHLAAASELLGHPSVLAFYPFVGFMLWPLIAVAVTNGAYQDIARYAEMLVDPSAQKLTAPIEEALRVLMVSPSDSAAIDVVLAWARSVHFL
jgi:DNA-binding SARP family transcriptional activator/tetratricopeptide (TPR) repeat protein